MMNLISVSEFAKNLGISRQSVLKSAKRSLHDNYRGKFPKPEAIDDEGRMFWTIETVMKYKNFREKKVSRQG